MTGEAPARWDAFDVLVVSPTPTHPQDHGNRKRIAAVCAHIKACGGRVHFVHYASEQAWRHGIPKAATDHMLASWDSYQLVAPSRPLHEGATAGDHAIDDWADPALTSYIAWVTGVRKFDVAIVNYTWLSFCLEAIPSSVFKILDTHDKFSHRRRLLESHAIPPEFFHTTEGEEAKGLGRADLVWAIKDDEAAHFRRLLGRDGVVTVPFADPPRQIWKAAKDNDGWLNVGIVGARNNINRVNLEGFLADALPVIERYMAPVRFLVAGGICEDFVGSNHPSVQMLGRLPDLGDFYRDIDIVAVPMRFGSGQKIKTGEAFATGAPVISHAHGSEGYEVSHPFHQAASFAAMGEMLAKLSFDRAPLAALAKESVKVARSCRARFEAAMDLTATRAARSMDDLCIVVGADSLDRRGILGAHLESMLAYLAPSRGATVFVSGGVLPPAQDMIHTQGARIYLDPGFDGATGDEVSSDWTVMSFDALAGSRTFRSLYLAGAPEIPDAVLRGLDVIYLRRDAALEAGVPDAVWRDWADRLPPGPVVAPIGAGMYETAAFAPARCDGPARQIPWARGGVDCLFDRNGDGHDGVLIVAGEDGGGGPVAVLRELCSSLSVEMRTVSTSVRLSDPGGDGESGPAPRIGRPRSRWGRPNVVIDLDGCSDRSAIITEAATWARIPVITAVLGDAGKSALNAQLGPSTLRSLLRIVARAIGDGDYYKMLQARGERFGESRLGADAGWRWLRDDLASGAARRRASAATLFGA